MGQGLNPRQPLGRHAIGWHVRLSFRPDGLCTLQVEVAHMVGSLKVLDLGISRSNSLISTENRGLLSGLCSCFNGVDCLLMNLSVKA